MNKKVFYFLAGIALAYGSSAAYASDTVATVPDGMMSFTLKHGVTNYLSLPLTKAPLYTGTVSALSTNSITVDDSPLPFTFDLGSVDSPYFVKFLSGKEEGRVLLVTANTLGTLTVDTTDHVSGAAVALTTTGFDVAVGDSFEVFLADTLSSVFGNNTTIPLVLTGGANSVVSDTVCLYSASNAPELTYFFNSVSNHWERVGTGLVSDSAIIYPYSAFTVLRKAAHPDTALVVSGRVTQVMAQTKVVPRASIYTSSHFASDITLSQLQFGSNWTMGATAATADTISVWNATLGKFEVFYQKPDLTWRSSANQNTDQSNYVVPAGAVTTIAKKAMVSGAATFLHTNLPYSLN